MKNTIIILILVLSSCIEPLDVNFSGQGSNILVVEGGIHTGKGPFGIQLTRSARYDSLISLEGGAQVSIRDDLGTVEFLTEIRTGVYRTSATYSAEVGRSYILQIVTADGTRYSSLPDKVEPVVSIDSIWATYKVRSTNDPEVDEVGLQVNLDFTDLADSKNYYLWTYRGHYEVNTCCATCWAYDNDGFPNFANDQSFDGSSYTAPIVYVADDGVRFSDKYIIAVNQYSLSTDAYKFYELVNQQLNIDGDIFDPPPATIRGNMINMDDPDDPVIGYFRASDVSQDTLVLYRDQIADPQPLRILRSDCRNWGNATNDRPDFWF